MCGVSTVASCRSSRRCVLVSMTNVRISRAAAVRGRLLFGSRDCTPNSTFGRSIFESRQVPLCHWRSSAIDGRAHEHTSAATASNARLVIMNPTHHVTP